MALQGTYDWDRSQGHILITQNNIININHLVQEIIIPGSIIKLDNNKLIMVKPSVDIIFGVLNLSSKTSYGRTKTGGTKRKFIPHNKKYPEFIVGTSKPFQVFDQYVSIKFEKIEKNQILGNICEYFGDVGDIDAEIKYYTKYATSSWNKKIDFTREEIKDDCTRIDYLEENIISIDPENCQDIDDALHLKKIESDHWELGIHIADVSSYIKENTSLDLEIRKRSESLYLPTQQVNMIPDNLSIDHISLKKNSPKRACSLIMKLDKDGKILEHKFVRSLIKVKENYAYETIDKLIMENNAPDYIDNLYSLAIKIQKHREKSTLNNILNSGRYDSHIMIEIYMVLANSIAAHSLENKYPLILRTHKGYKNKSDNLVNIYNMQKAEYTYISDTSDLKDSSHVGLGEDLYTHFTSPIRRYADILVHRLLYTSTNITHDLIYHLNKQQKLYNSVQRELDLVIKLNKLNEDNTVHILEAQIMGINRERIFVKISTWDISTEINIISKKLLHLYSTEEKDDKIIIINKDTQKMLELFLLQKIKIKASITMRSKNKINCSIIEPQFDHTYMSSYL